MGTRVLQFAFSGEPTGSIKSRHHPINIPPNSVVYSGTHDNAPAAQWFNELPAANKAKVVGLLNDCAVKDVPHQFIRLAMGSAAKFCIVTMQDVIGGGKSTRMNSPGTHSNANWSWRLEEFPTHAAKSLAHLSDIYERNV
jgi:4-alpha-glucanotransferase